MFKTVLLKDLSLFSISLQNPYQLTMRLLALDENGQFSLTKDLIHHIPPYAILSHTWGDDGEEVSFRDLVKDFGKAKSGTTGYRKILFCGEQAKNDGLEYFWVDSCCS